MEARRLPVEARRRRAFLLLSALLCVSVTAASETAVVTRVVDGDTLVVDIAGQEERVRLIGVDTPETVHPNKPVERFGKEASAFTKRVAEGETVRLESDPQNSNRDRYSRLLRYVYLPDGTCLNEEIIRRGYGFAYVKYPFSKMEEYRLLERTAREESRGLWRQPDRKKRNDRTYRRSRSTTESDEKKARCRSWTTGPE